LISIKWIAPLSKKPTGATTLEWTLPSPPPFHTYEALPRISESTHH